MEKMNDLKDLLKHEIEDLYSVEEQIIEALPKMIEKANNKTLKNSLTEHLKITEVQKERLDQIQQLMNTGNEEENGKSKGFLSGLFGGTHVCKGMKGIIDEGNKVMGEDMSPEVMDAAIIACAQKVEHYEICGYGTARSFARELNLEKVAKLLEQTLSEEYEADDRLTELAVGRINEQAEKAGGQSGDSSASGSNKRAGREPSRERATSAKREMEPVSTRGTTAKTERKTSAASKGGQPKSSGSAPRSNGTGRGAASSKRSASSSRTSKAAAKSTGRSNGRSSSGGRGSGSSSGRGRK